jgi:membrane protease YdiL (CAAX protease family)
MKNYVKSYWKVILFFVVTGLIGGFFLGLYTLDSYPEAMQEELLSQGINQYVLGIVTAVQSAGYGLILGAIGILLSKQIGLWKDEIKFEKTQIIESAVIALIGGMAMILLDIWFFGNYSQVILDSYKIKPTLAYILASVTYGAVIEEVMLRLFFMSLIAFVLHRLFEKNSEQVSDIIFIIANIIAALLFAAGHLPATEMLIGLSPMIVFRCFLLNGSLGILFGRLYRKYGLHYAMLAHGGCHIVSKLIWIFFI